MLDLLYGKKTSFVGSESPADYHHYSYWAPAEINYGQRWGARLLLAHN